MPNIWVREIRAPFLLLPMVIVPVGAAIAWTHGSFDPLAALLTLIGVLSMHAGVNVLNDYFDFRSGIDLATTPTPFSGGSRVLPARELSPNSVLSAGVLFLVVGLGIGSYFVYRFAFSPILLGIIAIAAVSVVGYSPIISHWGMGEFVAGLNFGPLLVIGTYYLQTGKIALDPVIIGTALGIMVGGILYINEFPDTVADQKGGRRHLVILWGKAKAASRFRVLVASAFLLIAAGVATRTVTPLAVISFLALPKAWTATRILSRDYAKTAELIPGMASMVMATLWMGGLLLVAYLVQGLSLLL